MKGIILWMAGCLPFTAYGQAFLSVDKTEIKIGDQVHTSLQFKLGEGRTWLNEENIWPDTVQGIEVVKGPEINKENIDAIHIKWTLAFFDTGWVRIPALPLVVLYNGKVDTIFTNDVPVNVLIVEPDSAGLLEIKDIYAQPFNPGYYKKYIPHLIIFLLIIIGLILWLRKRKASREPIIITPYEPLPHEWAYTQLDELKEKKLWQRGEVKEHYTMLTAILREYLERRFGIRAMEQTSDEIIFQLHIQNLDPALLSDTGQLLSVADLIKFAKADPGMNIHAATIERVRSFVQATAASPVVENTESTSTPGDAIVE